MSVEFSCREVTLSVLAQLERRRPDIAFDTQKVRAEIETALAPVRKDYEEAELPPAYFTALADEVRRTVPARWQPLAREFTISEKKQFGLWRGGDPVARVTYVLAAMALGGLMVWLPFIPIWEKWFPFVLALGAFFLPDAQAAWHRRRYARALGEIAVTLDKAQPQLDAYFTADLALLPNQGPDDAVERRSEASPKASPNPAKEKQ